MEAEGALHSIWGIVQYYLSPIEKLCLRLVCRKTQNFFSFARLHAERPVKLPSGVDVDTLFSECWYLMFLELPDLSALQASITYHGHANAWKLQTQGFVRGLSYSGTLTHGVLEVHVQPTVAWKKKAVRKNEDEPRDNDHVVKFNVENGCLVTGPCGCRNG